MSSQEVPKIQFDLATVIIGSLFIIGIILTMIVWCGKTGIELLSTASGNQSDYEACKSEYQDLTKYFFEMNNSWQLSNDNFVAAIKDACGKGTPETLCPPDTLPSPSE